MSGDYRDDREWSDLMSDQIRTIVGPHLLRPTSFEVDTKQAADFFVFTAENMTIAARLRRPGYDNFRYEVTVRSSRDSGVKTELAKIIDGWGNWFFYGHTNPQNKIHLWWLVDLKSFRAGLIRHGREARLNFSKKSNRDGTHFVAYDSRSFPSDPAILIASSHSLLGESEAA